MASFESLPVQIHQARESVRREWARYATVAQFIQDHLPEDWEQVQDCRQTYRKQYDRDREDVWRIVPRACWRVPPCVIDTRIGNHVRAMESFDRFSRCTPRDQPLRFLHMVVTAPLTEQGQGWGWAASENIGGFALVVQRFLKEVFGPGVGGQMSYQDFGERAFQKRHPHWDITVNGYLIQDGTWRRLSPPNLEGGGYRRLIEEPLARHAQVLEVGATPGNVWIGKPKEGVKAYYHEMKYQVRELVDFRKVEYDRRTQVVRWKHYDGRQETRLTAERFLDGLEEYRGRVLQGRSANRLHRRFGHMADSQLSGSEAVVGGTPLVHDAACGCGGCRDWEPLHVEESEFGLGLPRGHPTSRMRR